MTESLAELTAAEARVLDRLPVAEADTSWDVYVEYEAVAEGYCRLASKGDQESLKRLVFLWWYAESEPSHLSGLQEFTPALSRQTAHLLVEAVNEGVDEEFRRMLTWYYSITEWHFEEWVPEVGLDLRGQLSENRLPSGVTDLGVVDLESDRGAMGQYFRSMRAAQETKS